LNAKIIGVGGQGISTIDYIKETTDIQLETIAMHTDARSLLKTKADQKLLLGRNTTYGRSTGNNILLGEQAAEEESERIGMLVDGVELIFLIAGIGGGTGAGSTRIIAETAKKHGARIISFVNIPFVAEGKSCMKNASKSLTSLKYLCEMTIVFEKEKLNQASQGVTIEEAFDLEDQMIVEGIKALLTIDKDNPELFQEIQDNIAVLGFAQEDELDEAIKKAMESPFISLDINSSKKMLLFVIAQKEKYITDFPTMMQSIQRKNPNTEIYWQPEIRKNFPKDIGILIIASGLDLELKLI